MKHHKGMRDGILLENSNDRYNELYTKNIYIYIYNMSDEKAEFEMPFDTEEKLLDAMNRTKNDLKLTKEEETRLTKAFKEPEFKKLLGEYMQEISDPKNRAEYEQYINQMEHDDKVPKDMKIIKPKGGFVIKTKKLGKKVEGDASRIVPPAMLWPR